ncbi:arginyltransferase [Larsenimonas rhizosphaerae]|uniref:Aspartate/glutamate leucyltransferase n=1 Tax=Larsenimonas rhizosphaerae TaxID=2944682 RepID=A0AA41ZI74_9GAMM|nr:arginyltransferase [Larsenimonas rhizosphaerae]MCX2524654.1 arginyltransferase [Larsenimonas rhizosphaerae]
MSNPTTTRTQDLRFFLTAPHSCSYLENKEAITLFMDPEQPINQDVYSALSLMGFRRSGQHLYRPHCNNCKECLSVRIPVEDFTPNKTQRRLFKRNQYLTVNNLQASFVEEHYLLYERYIAARHQDGDMYPPSREQYASFLTHNNEFSRLIEFRNGAELVAVAAMDELSHGLSAIYTFYSPAPEHAPLSLGTHAVLWQIEQAKSLGLPYVYLGYWIERNRKMAYKTLFRPIEYLEGRSWQRLIDCS